MNPEWLALLATLPIAIGAVWFYIRDTDSDGRAVLLFIGLILLALTCISALTFSFNRKSCRLFGEVNQWAHQYTVMNGCLLEVEPGRWIPRGAVYSQVEDLR